MYSNHGSSPELSDPAEPSRQSTTSYLRPQYDARKQSSEPGPYLNYPRNESPASSRGTSRTRVDSRPPSLHSSHTLSSTEDVRLRDKRASSSSKRASQSSELQGLMMQQQFVPYAWAGVPAVPVMPYMQFYPTNMELLPPTAPFMMQGSRRSASPSPSRASQSVERLPPPKRESVHQRHSSGEVPSSKRASTSSRTPSVASSRERIQPSRSAASQGQTPTRSSLNPSLNPSLNIRPSLPQTSRRQTAVT